MAIVSELDREDLHLFKQGTKYIINTSYVFIVYARFICRASGKSKARVSSV